MATKSITKNISIHGNKQCGRLVNAFEQAEAKSTSRNLDAVVLSRSCGSMDNEEIRTLFAKEKKGE